MSYTIQQLVDYCSGYPLDSVKLEINCENSGYENDDYESKAILYVEKEIKITAEEIERNFKKKLDDYQRYLNIYNKMLKKYEKDMIAYKEYEKKEKN